jgi:hypothetical protein
VLGDDVHPRNCPQFGNAAQAGEGDELFDLVELAKRVEKHLAELADGVIARRWVYQPTEMTRSPGF